MENNVYGFKLKIGWKLINLISEIDRFDSQWTAIERKEGQSLKQSNAVEATFPNGKKQIIFQTSEAGFATEDAIRKLIEWYNGEKEVHALIKCAVFTYEFLSIHPFQDGNGRLSRLFSTLLLLKNGYSWIQYVSFEHETESPEAKTSGLFYGFQFSPFFSWR